MTHLQLLIEAQHRIKKLERHIVAITKSDSDVIETLHRQISMYQAEIRRMHNRLFRYAMEDGQQESHRYAVVTPTLDPNSVTDYTTITTLADMNEALDLADEMIAEYDLPCDVYDVLEGKQVIRPDGTTECA